MENVLLQTIENLFYKKILLYNDLLHCFKQERACLVQIDVDQLWQVARQKEALCDSIAAVRREIVSVLYPDESRREFRLDEVVQQMPAAYQDRFRPLAIRLTELKREIDIIRKESKVFIDESLLFLDEIIGVISGETRLRTTYNHKCGFKKSQTRYLLNREV